MHWSSAKALTVETTCRLSGPTSQAARLPLQRRQRFMHDVARPLDISGDVRCGNEASFKLRWGEIDASLQTSVKETGEQFQIASLRAGEIDNRRGSKEQTKHRTQPVKGD